MACAPPSRGPIRSPAASSRTIRERLIKIGARVIEHIARIPYGQKIETEKRQ
jgi:hypothetical protein